MKENSTSRAEDVESCGTNTVLLPSRFATPSGGIIIHISTTGTVVRWRRFSSTCTVSHRNTKVDLIDISLASSLESDPKSYIIVISI